MDGFYDSVAWRKLAGTIRRRWLAEARPCSWCGKAIGPGQRSIVDHTLPRRQRPDLALVASNLVLMHHRCHSAKTAAVDYNTRPRTNLDGFPEGSDWV